MEALAYAGEELTTLTIRLEASDNVSGERKPDRTELHNELRPSWYILSKKVIVDQRSVNNRVQPSRC